MNLYKVSYKDYQSTKDIHIVAANTGKAVERATAYIKKNFYGKEILTVEKVLAIEAISK